jgi:hypothetical protein
MVKTATVVALLALIPYAGSAQSRQAFSAHHEIQFVPGTDAVRKLAGAHPSARGIVQGRFVVATVDLNDDGSNELILLGAHAGTCGTEGCGLVVLDFSSGASTPILDRHVFSPLAVTNEKVTGYRALAVINKGVIAVGDHPASPLFGQQLVYPIERATPPAPAVPTARPQAPTVCGGPLCTENQLFAASITDFRAILDSSPKTLMVRMSFVNKLDRPIALGYVRMSGVATDDRGNRYVPSGERSVQGIGEVSGNAADAKFVLQPGETSDARFEFAWHASGQELFGLSFQLDLAIREIVRLPGNQLQLGREYALHFTRAEQASTTDLLSARSPAPRRPGPPPSGSRPLPEPASADGCLGSAQGPCVSAGPFAAEITGLIPSFASNGLTHVLKAKVRFRNRTREPIIVGFVARSAVMVDNYGGRYTIDPSLLGEGVAGIGIVQRTTADPQFVLEPDESGEAAFTLSRRRNYDKTDALGTAFTFDLTIAHLEVLESQQVRTSREYSVGFTGLTLTPVDGRSETSRCRTSKGPVYCARPFVAEVTRATAATVAPVTHVIRARIRFTNVTDRPIALAYVSDSAVAVDAYGARYVVNNPNMGDGVEGLGALRGPKIDARFVLPPGASEEATVTLSRRRRDDRSDAVGSVVALDLTIAEVEPLPSQQIRRVRDYAVSYSGVSIAGTLLDRVLQALPKKGGQQ